MISLTDYSIQYDNGFTAIHPLSIEFNSGEFTVLLGASGAGKSSLLRSINCLVKASSGCVSIRGLGNPFLSSKNMRRHRRNTAMVFQQHQLFGRLTVLQNVLIGRIGYYSSFASLFPFSKNDKFYALECLERVGIYDKALERADNLSGGQQQRVGIARALMQKPNIMLADEPVASLDPETSRKVLSLIHKICKEDGITALVSLHQVEFAQAFADRIVALSSGRIIFDGQSQELSSNITEEIYKKNESPFENPDFKLEQSEKPDTITN